MAKGMFEKGNSLASKDYLLFRGETSDAASLSSRALSDDAKSIEPWLVMIVDDDEIIHAVTELVLDGYIFMGRGLRMLHAYSGDSYTCSCRLKNRKGASFSAMVTVTPLRDDAGKSSHLICAGRKAA